MLKTIGREGLSATYVDPQLQEASQRAYQLAKAMLPASVEPPRRVADPENDPEWWLTIVARCRGSAASILGAYNALIDRFVAEVPAEARNRIRFEILVDG
jgi:hypothetical protein